MSRRGWRNTITASCWRRPGCPSMCRSPRGMNRASRSCSTACATEARLADVCRALEQRPAVRLSPQQQVVEMQATWIAQVGAKYLETLHLATRAEVARGVAAPALLPSAGGWRRDRAGRPLALLLHRPELRVSRRRRAARWAELTRPPLARQWAALSPHARRAFCGSARRCSRPRICRSRVRRCSAMATRTMRISGSSQRRLVFFDPAFAGAHLPALLAEIKPTFHNIFAHPDWLYHPADAALELRGQATVRNGVLEVEHDWELPALRAAFLESKMSSSGSRSCAALA